ncbi:MAG: hypothetical protein PHQ19_00260 [Candidatus Krumholzibacteria bacterium]|nr:hypothetical protein [Candidatus Krumholzibacteria bacterium]
MSGRGPVYILAVLSLCAPCAMPMQAHAQCYGPMYLEQGFFEYDFIVRLAVHFGDEQEIPGGVICGRHRYPEEETVEAPIWFYNAHQGIVELEFAVESNDSLVGFTPNTGWEVLQASVSAAGGSIHHLDLKLQACAPLCGPGLAGWALVKPAPGSDLTWINLLPNGDTGRMRAVDGDYLPRYLFSPHHGGYIGEGWLYTCQEPICDEPNEAVSRLIAEADYGHWVKLAWIAGGGNTTVVRARLDRFPAGYADGRLVAEIPSAPGQHQICYDTGAPLNTLVYYAAFSLTREGGAVTLDSFIECAAVDTAMTTSVIATEPASWGAIKTLQGR